MQKQQQYQVSQQYQSTSIIIPCQKLIKYYQHYGIHKKQYQYFQLRQIPQSKFKTTYGTYSSQSLIKLMNIIQQNENDFLQIIGFNTTLTKSTKKQFIINRLLREYSYFNFFDLLNQLQYIRNQLKDQQMYQQMIQFIKLILQKIKFLLQKHCETLIMVQGQCLNFYLRKRIKQNKKYLIKSSSQKTNNNEQQHHQQNYYENINNLLTQDDYQYSLVIAIDSVSISFCSSNQFIHSIMLGLLTHLKKTCLEHGYDLDNDQFSLQNIQASSDQNSFNNDQIPSFFKQSYDKKVYNTFNRIKQLNMPQSFYSNLMLNTLTKYVEDIFYLIEGTLVALTNLILQKKQIKNISYDEQYISIKHPLKQQPLKQSFVNLYCQHYQGIPYELYKNGTNCPYCNQYIIVDQSKCFERNRNIFQNLLTKNYINQNEKDILYYFKQKIFCLANQQKYQHYPHFRQFFISKNFLRDRPQVLMILTHQKISLYNKLWGKKKLFCADQLIQTPVRGKYCRHLQFYDLLRVYQKFIKKQQKQESFDCFICSQPINYSQLMYLHQIKLLIDLARVNFYPTIQQVSINTFLKINHQKQNVELCTQLEKGYMKKIYKLPIYDTLIDPLTKSQKNSEEQKNNNSEEQHQFQYTEQFSDFFFGQ